MFIAARREISSASLRVARHDEHGAATIDISGGDATGFYVMLDTPADCDALIAAAVEAKRLLDPPETFIFTDEDGGEDGPVDDEAELRRADVIAGNQNMTSKECIARVAHGGEDEAEPGLCDSEMPLPNGGRLACTLDDYHDGAHSAVAGKYRWLGTGVAARTEDGEWIAKAEPASPGAAGALIDAIVAGTPVKAERPFDAGEGSRELSGPGRELLATAIADEDAASAS
jgi:hypothetical protein